MILKAVLFDLHNTLVHLSNPLSSKDISEFLLQRGYEVYPQSWDAASHYVGMIDYPKHGYNNRQAFLRQVLHRLDIRIDGKTQRELALLFEKRNAYHLFPDAVPALLETRQLGLKSAIVTTIPDFAFQSAIKTIINDFDVIMTGYRAGCEKSNPLMHKKTLQELGVTPNHAVMIGDELLVDVHIPRSLGMRTILLDRQKTLRSRSKEADSKASTLTEAIAVVKKWQAT